MHVFCADSNEIAGTRFAILDSTRKGPFKDKERAGEMIVETVGSAMEDLLEDEKKN